MHAVLGNRATFAIGYARLNARATLACLSQPSQAIHDVHKLLALTTITPASRAWLKPASRVRRSPKLRSEVKVSSVYKLSKTLGTGGKISERWTSC